MTWTPVGQAVQRQDVCIGEVEDVDVVSDARAVACRVVVAEDRDVLASPGGGVEYERDQVRFRIVALSAPHAGACRVEIAEGGHTEAGGRGKPRQGHPKSQLGMCV